MPVGMAVGMPVGARAPISACLVQLYTGKISSTWMWAATNVSYETEVSPLAVAPSEERSFQVARWEACRVAYPCMAQMGGDEERCTGRVRLVQAVHVHF